MIIGVKVCVIGSLYIDIEIQGKQCRTFAEVFFL